MITPCNHIDCTRAAVVIMTATQQSGLSWQIPTPLCAEHRKTVEQVLRMCGVDPDTECLWTLPALPDNFTPGTIHECFPDPCQCAECQARRNAYQRGLAGKLHKL